MFPNDFRAVFSQWWTEAGSCPSGLKHLRVSAAFGFASASFLLTSYLTLTCSRSELRDVLYSLVGDLCHLAGAFLSNQTFLQCFMASVMVTLDAVHFTVVALRQCWWYRPSPGRRERIFSRRKRQNFLATCLLFGIGGCVYADIRARHVQTTGSPSSRKLLSVIVRDRTELLGYVLGLLSFTIIWTSRIPFFLKANRGEMSNSAHVSSRGFSALAGAFYASAVLLYDPRLKSVVKALPWILSGACCAVLDASILLLSCYRICYKRQSITALDSDTESLLGDFRRVTSAPYNPPKNKNARKYVSSSSKNPEMRPDRSTIVQPIRKMCLKEVTITRADSDKSQPLKGSVKVVRVDECYNSGTSTDSSCLSSELEWDFEQSPPQWNSQKGEAKTDAFPLQDWALDQKSKSNMSPSSSACYCTSSDVEERLVSGSPDSKSQRLSDSAK